MSAVDLMMLIKQIKSISTNEFIIWYTNKALNNLNLSDNEIIFNSIVNEEDKALNVKLFSSCFCKNVEKTFYVEKVKKELIEAISKKYKLFKITLYFYDKIFNWKNFKVELICIEKSVQENIVYYSGDESNSSEYLAIVNLEYDLIYDNFNILSGDTIKLKFNGYQFYDINFNENYIINSYTFRDCDISPLN